MAAPTTGRIWPRGNPTPLVPAVGSYYGCGTGTTDATVRHAAQQYTFGTAGTLTKVKFYVAVASTVTHKVGLATSLPANAAATTWLASATVTTNAIGWAEATLDTPVAVTAGQQLYVVAQQTTELGSALGCYLSVSLGGNPPAPVGGVTVAASSRYYNQSTANSAWGGPNDVYLAVQFYAAGAGPAGQLWPRPRWPLPPTVPGITGPWTAKTTTFPLTQMFGRAATLGSLIYVTSGTTLYAYDPVADSYTTKAACPINMDGATLVAYSGKLYMWNYGATAHHVYDPVANSWANTLAQMPLDGGGYQEAYQASYAVGGSKLYISAGTGQGYGTATNIYDFGTNTWSTGAAMPSHRGETSCGWYGGKFYVFGGTYQNSTNPANGKTEVLCYDPGANSWSTKTPIPRKVVGGLGGVVGDSYYLAGGDDLSASSAKFAYRYDFATDSWTTIDTEPTYKRNDGWATVFGGKLYIGGGEGLASAKIYMLG